MMCLLPYRAGELNYGSVIQLAQSSVTGAIASKARYFNECRRFHHSAVPTEAIRAISDRKAKNSQTRSQNSAFAHVLLKNRNGEFSREIGGVNSAIRSTR